MRRKVCRGSNSRRSDVPSICNSQRSCEEDFGDEAFRRRSLERLPARGKDSGDEDGRRKDVGCHNAVVLNALKGKGVHVVTVNDYLAKRDAEWMGKVYRSSGCLSG